MDKQERRVSGPIPFPDSGYSRTTRSITVSVQPLFLEDESAPASHRYVWAYHVRIENTGTETVQLLKRTWQITDSTGRVQDVHGDGVVGKQPVLSPRGVFEYTSAAPLTTPSGIMVGSYHMATESGEAFDVEIPAFSLDSPYAQAMLH